MEDFVPFLLAKKLKEKGFRELCLAYYTNDNTLYYNYSHKAGASYTDCYLSHNLIPKDSVSGKFVDAPTISQVLKWLREKKDLFVQIMFVDKSLYYYEVIDIAADKVKCSIGDYKESPELAALAGIEYVIDNIL